MIVMCENKNCRHNVYDKTKDSHGFCNLENISLNIEGGCESEEPIFRCGDCKKYGTKDCKWHCYVDEKESASIACFVGQDIMPSPHAEAGECIKQIDRDIH